MASAGYTGDAAKAVDSGAPAPSPSPAEGQDGKAAAQALDLLLKACRRAYAIEESVTAGQERELRVGYRDLLRAAIAAAEAAK